jgi:hypothetical protein
MALGGSTLCCESVTPSVTKSNVVEPFRPGNKTSARTRDYGAAASSVAAKSVCGTGPTHGEVAPASW